MLFYIIIGTLGLLFILIFTILLINGNKLKVMNLKIMEAENNISDILKEKYELLNKIKEIMKKKGKDDFLKDLETIDIEKLNNNQLNKELSKYDKTITELIEYNKEIVFDEEEEEIFDKLNKINNNGLAIEKYYNDNASKFNNSISKFPSSIISSIKGYEEKELFENEKEEIFEILKK